MDVVKHYYTKNGEPNIDVLLMNSPFSQLIGSRDGDYGAETPVEQNFFRSVLNVPVIQIMNHTGEFLDFEATAEGLRKSEIRSMVSWPELDGQIISVPVSTQDSRTVCKTSCRQQAGRRCPSVHPLEVVRCQRDANHLRTGYHVHPSVTRTVDES